MSGENDHEIVECPLCGSDYAGVPRFKANAYLNLGHGVDDVLLLKKAATRFAVNVDPSNDWSDAYFFRILRDVLRASIAAPPGTEIVPEGTRDPRMSLYEAEQYADEMENATIAYFRSSTPKTSKRFCDAKGKLILALTGAAQKDKETPNAQG